MTTPPDPRIGTVMDTRGRFTFGEHTTHIEVVDGSSVGFTLAHVVHCACGHESNPIAWTDVAELAAWRHAFQANERMTQ